MARRFGSVTTAPMKSGARFRMWRAMRMLRQFTIADLVATAEASHANATRFVWALTRAGYLRIVTPKRSGRKGGAAVYLLARDTGPYAPRHRRDGTIFDSSGSDVATLGEGNGENGGR